MDVTPATNLNIHDIVSADSTSTVDNVSYVNECTGSCLDIGDEYTVPFQFIFHNFVPTQDSPLTPNGYTKAKPTEYSLLNYAPYRIWFLVIDFTLILPTIFGNILILIALSRYKVLRKIKGFVLIGNLAVADLLVGLVFLPMDITLHLINSLLDNGIYCLFYYSILYTLLTASVLNLLLLSVERCHAIMRPYRHVTRFTTKRLSMVICITWISVVILGFLPLAGWQPHTIESDKVCKSSILFTDKYQKIMIAIVTAAFIVSFICFIAVIRVALRKAEETKRKNITDEYFSGPNLKRDVDYTKLLLFVSGIFIICWGPFCIISFFPTSTVNMLYIKNFLASLGIVNSCLNWIVYGVRNRKFRAAFKDIVTCNCRRPDHEQHIISNQTESTQCI